MTWYHNVEDSSLSASVTSFLVEIEVFDLFWFCTTWRPSSSMRAEYGHCIGRGIWPLLYWFCLLWCPSSSIELNLDIALRLGHLVPWCTFIAGDSTLHGYLVISSKLFVLILPEIVWCRAELSALHHVSRCWNFVLAERDVLENEYEVWGSFVNQNNIVQNICNHLLRSWV